MKIGVISDTHDNKDNIIYFVDKFIEEKVDTVFHCGDVVAPFVTPWFKKLTDAGIKLYLVFGNNDGELYGLRKIFGEICQVKGNFFETELDGKKIVAFHHLSPTMVEALARSGSYDLILKGHTHQFLNQKIGNTLVLNPGEACGYLTGKSTVAVVDLQNMGVRILEK